MPRDERSYQLSYFRTSYLVTSETVSQSWWRL